MDTQLAPQHAWLRSLAGSWTFKLEFSVGPMQSPNRSEGMEIVRTLGEFWIVVESRVVIGEDGLRAIMTLGYDPARGKFVGTRVVSSLPFMSTFEGELCNDGMILPLMWRGPSLHDPTRIVTYQDVIEIKSITHRALRSQVLDEDGQWIRFLAADYRRAD